MADRFPSLDDFGEAPSGNEIDVTGGEDDFLARERATLGQDAAQFADANGHDGDLLDAETVAPEAVFESSFPAVESSQQTSQAPITSTSLPYRPFEPMEEPEPVRAWRERRDMALAERDRVSAAKKEETIKAARQNLDDFYENYSQKTEKQVARTQQEAKEFLAAREDTTAGGTSWERIAKLVDLSGKGAAGGASGTSKQKFRDLLLDLKKDQKAPGIAGV